MRADFLEKIQDLHSVHKAYCIVTLVSARGSTPQEIGAKILITEEGLFSGTIGGGKLEAAALQRAQELIGKNSICELITWNLQKDIGMSCGGEVQLLFEYSAKRIQIAIFGAGHVSQALTRTLLNMEFQIQVFDTREEWINKLPESTKLQKILSKNLAEEVNKLAPDTYLLCMTQGHATDFPILRAALQKNSHAYLGVLGSTIKSQKIRNELKEAGLPVERIEKIHCPMGLNLGNNTPEEIAISITAQILQERDIVANHYSYKEE